MNKELIYSGIVLNAKDFDEKKGIVSFYFADFNSVDSHGRRMGEKSFNRTIKNNAEKMYHLFGHDPNQVIGKPLELGTDDKGAYMTSKLLNTPRGQEVLEGYREGIYNQHSFKAYIINSHDEDNVEVVDELQMVEASTVLEAANVNTPTIAVNQLDELLKNQNINNEILTKIDLIMNALGLGKDHLNPQPLVEKFDVDEFIRLLKS